MGLGGLAGWGLQGCRCWVEVVLFFWVKVPNIIWNSSLYSFIKLFLLLGCSQFQSKNAENQWISKSTLVCSMFLAVFEVQVLEDGRLEFQKLPVIRWDAPWITYLR